MASVVVDVVVVAEGCTELTVVVKEESVSAMHNGREVKCIYA